MEAGPLVVIVGPTASGKTKLAIDLAQQFGGEIICADSRTVYKDMDIGTAKPTATEREMVPHWGLDLVEPSERFTAADFQVYAAQKIEEIRARGNIPFLVGGTGLYVDSVIFDYQFGDDRDQIQREKLEGMSLEALHKYCKEFNIELPENNKNKRYVIRAIEQKSLNNRRRSSPISNSIIVGIATESNELRTKMFQRNEQLLQDGVVEEARILGEKYGWDSEAMTGNIYRLAHKYIEGQISEEDLLESATTNDWRLAKRQLTWFRRNHFIQWLQLGEARSYLHDHLESWRFS